MTALRPRCDGQSGVTLVEMLVALAIFAFVGLAAFAMLDTLLRVQDQTDGRLTALAQLDRALLVLDRDLAQGRPETLTLADGVVAIGRGRGQGFAYAVKDGVWQRSVTPAATMGSAAFAQALVPQVRGTATRALDPAGDWHDVWPAEGIVHDPRAVEVVLTFEDGTRVLKLVPLARMVTR